MRDYQSGVPDAGLVAPASLPEHAVMIPNGLGNGMAKALGRGMATFCFLERRWSLPNPFLSANPAADRVCEMAIRAAKRPANTAAARWFKAAQYRAHYHRWHAEFTGSDPRLLMVWNGLKSLDGVIAGAAKDAGCPVLHMELTPFPGRMSMDLGGINATNSLPRRADFYRDWAQTAPDNGHWRSLRRSLVARAAKGGTVRQDRRDLAGVGRFIFVPLQVPQDTQVRMFGGWLNSVEGMVDALARASRALPHGWHLRLKEHPSAKRPLGDALARHLGPKLVVDNVTNTFDQVAASEAVLTLNSSVGVQAYAYEKPVITLGEAFWDFGGMAVKAGSAQALAEVLSRPSALTFDEGLREAFLDYCLTEHFPEEGAILSGQWTLGSLLARDAARRARLARLDRAATWNSAA